jgi:DNA repair protein RadA/Sms
VRKHKTSFVCQSCFYEVSRWQGHCQRCNSWNSFEEQIKHKKNHDPFLKSRPIAISEIKLTKIVKIKTEVESLDKVLGGGLVESALNLISGRPGIGKSTLATIICGNIAKLFSDETVLYISGEETKRQVALRFGKYQFNNKNIYVLNETNWENIEEMINGLRPKVLIVDSIQTLYISSSGMMKNAPINEVIESLQRYLNSNKSFGIVLGHVNKKGQVAGSKFLEHMVDVVIKLEDSIDSSEIIFKTLKNRHAAVASSAAKIL